MTIYPLISVEALLASPGAVVLDCRFDLADPARGRAQYLEGHIPGAHYVDLNADLSSPVQRHGGRHPLPLPGAFEATMRRLGIGPDTRVVAYDDNRGAFAARLWWLLRYFGHEQVQVLDGGLGAWREGGHALSQELPGPVHATAFVARPRTDWVVDVAGVQAALSGAGVQVVDARDADRYAGLIEPLDPAAGHIPGALNLPWSSAVGADGRFLGGDGQRERWASLGDAPGGRVVYCGSGVTACANLLSLALAGEPPARLYAGSWSDWCSHPELPVATGA